MNFMQEVEQNKDAGTQGHVGNEEEADVGNADSTDGVVLINGNETKEE